MRTSSKIMGATILLLGLLSFFIWSAATSAASKTLTVSLLDTGKGTVTLIRAPQGRLVLIDGGGGASILRSLGALLPWYQRSVDVVISAHPDAAHTTGLIDVLQRYQVANIYTPGVRGSGPVMQAFGRMLTDAQKKGTVVRELRRGNVIDLGGAYIEVLFPDRDLSRAPAHDGCIEMRLVYGSTSFMLACGNASVEKYLARLDGSRLHSDVLSLDNGTASSTTPLFSGFVGAQYMATPGSTFASDGRTISSK